MKKSHLFYLAAICGGGLLTGFGLRRLSSENPAVVNRAALPARTESGRESPTPAIDPSRPAAPIPTRSTGTADSILALDPANNYARIARWLATASEQEIAAYWETFQKGKRDSDITDLIFISWTRLNPRGAITGAAAAGNQFSAWEAWAAHDPAAALAAAILAGPDKVSCVARGAGEYDPAWLRAHFEELPEPAREQALISMARWNDTANPLESLEFTKKTGGTCDEGTFKILARNDPWAALDLLKENPAFTDGRTSENNKFSDVLFSTMAEERPEELEALAARTPAGAVRRQMEQALFDHLLETDPAAALESARTVGAPLVAAQRLGQIGLGLISTDPDKAFEIAREILAATPGTLEIKNQVEYENGSMTSGNPGKASELMDALFTKDRERTLETIASQFAGGNSSDNPLSTYAGKWAEDDLDGFMDWTDRQSGKLQQVAAQPISSKLASQGDYTEAIDWAGRGMLDPGRAYSFVLSRWQSEDPAAAAAWVENSGLTNEQKAHYRDFLKRAAK